MRWHKARGCEGLNTLFFLNGMGANAHIASQGWVQYSEYCILQYCNTQC